MSLPISHIPCTLGLGGSLLVPRLVSPEAVFCFPTPAKCHKLCVIVTLNKSLVPVLFLHLPLSVLGGSLLWSILRGLKLFLL